MLHLNVCQGIWELLQNIFILNSICMRINGGKIKDKENSILVAKRGIYLILEWLTYLSLVRLGDFHALKRKKTRLFDKQTTLTEVTDFRYLINRKSIGYSIFLIHSANLLWLLFKAMIRSSLKIGAITTKVKYLSRPLANNANDNKQGEKYNDNSFYDE